jgi:Holliday junction resolvase RusA-like endonuclease
MANITFFVPGLPAPGGSKRAFVVGGRAVLTEDCKRSKPWRSRVAAVANDAHAGPPLDGPLALEMVFSLPRPKGHFGSGRNAGRVRPSAPAYPATKPDTTKLVRSTEDALKGIVWRDDAQVVEQVARKVYADRPGVLVTVYPMPPAAEIPADVDPPAGWPPQLGRSAEPEDLGLPFKD